METTEKKSLSSKKVTCGPDWQSAASWVESMSAAFLFVQGICPNRGLKEMVVLLVFLSEKGARKSTLHFETQAPILQIDIQRR